PNCRMCRMCPQGGRRADFPRLSRSATWPRSRGTQLAYSQSGIVLPSGQLSPSRSRRSEEHTSELQSRRDLVCRLLLEKKNKSHDARVLRLIDELVNFCVVESIDVAQVDVGGDQTRLTRGTGPDSPSVWRHKYRRPQFL